jgi:hypothetical protein
MSLLLDRAGVIRAQCGAWTGVLRNVGQGLLAITPSVRCPGELRRRSEEFFSAT